MMEAEKIDYEGSSRVAIERFMQQLGDRLGFSSCPSEVVQSDVPGGGYGLRAVPGDSDIDSNSIYIFGKYAGGAVIFHTPFQGERVWMGQYDEIVAQDEHVQLGDVGYHLVSLCNESWFPNACEFSFFDGSKTHYMFVTSGSEIRDQKELFIYYGDDYNHQKSNRASRLSMLHLADQISDAELARLYDYTDRLVTLQQTAEDDLENRFLLVINRELPSQDDCDRSFSSRFIDHYIDKQFVSLVAHNAYIRYLLLAKYQDNEPFCLFIINLVAKGRLSQYAQTVDFESRLLAAIVERRSELPSVAQWRLAMRCLCSDSTDAVVMPKGFDYSRFLDRGIAKRLAHIYRNFLRLLPDTVNDQMARLHELVKFVYSLDAVLKCTLTGRDYPTVYMSGYFDILLAIVGIYERHLDMTAAQTIFLVNALKLKINTLKKDFLEEVHQLPAQDSDDWRLIIGVHPGLEEFYRAVLEKIALFCFRLVDRNALTIWEEGMECYAESPIVWSKACFDGEYAVSKLADAVSLVIDSSAQQSQDQGLSSLDDGAVVSSHSFFKKSIADDFVESVMSSSGPEFQKK